MRKLREFLVLTPTCVVFSRALHRCNSREIYACTYATGHLVFVGFHAPKVGATNKYQWATGCI